MQVNEAALKEVSAEGGVNLNLVVAQSTTVSEDTLPTVVESSDAERIKSQAAAMADKIFSLKPADIEGQGVVRDEVRQRGRELIRQAAKESQLLTEPFRKLPIMAADEEEGSPGHCIVQLQKTAQKLDPRGIDFADAREPGFLGRALRKVGVVGDPIADYFAEFQNGQTIIASIVKSAEAHAEARERDIKFARLDQQKVRKASLVLATEAEYHMNLDEEIEYRLRDMSAEDPRKRFIETDLLFEIRQKTKALQKQRLANEQGYIVFETAIRNNEALLSGLTYGIDLTVTLMFIGAAAAQLLTGQKATMEMLTSLFTTADRLMESNAIMLEQQGTEIQEMIVQLGGGIEVYTRSFGNVLKAWDDVSTFKQKALAGLKTDIKALDDLANQGERVIQSIEQGNELRDGMVIDGEYTVTSDKTTA